MSELVNEALRAIAPYLSPAAQVALILVVAVFGILMMRKGDRDRKISKSESSTEGLIPMWAMMGPVHEVMQTIHDMAEESRNANIIAREMAESLHDLNKGQIYVIQLLEDLNNSRVTTDVTQIRPRKKPP